MVVVDMMVRKVRMMKLLRMYLSMSYIAIFLLRYYTAFMFGRILMFLVMIFICFSC